MGKELQEVTRGLLELDQERISIQGFGSQVLAAAQIKIQRSFDVI